VGINKNQAEANVEYCNFELRFKASSLRVFLEQRGLLFIMSRELLFGRYNGVLQVKGSIRVAGLHSNPITT